MRIDGAKVFGMVFALVASGVAAAATWDWELDFQTRHWRSSTLTWAQNIHPDRPSATWIQATFYPPPHEMWCHGSPSPRSADCTEFHELLNEWLEEYLETDSVPQSAFSSFPKECVSSCTP
jgi:hypothetical protein